MREGQAVADAKAPGALGVAGVALLLALFLVVGGIGLDRYLRNCKAAVIYEGTRDIHTLMQADWALGLKKEKPARKTLPPWKPAESRGAVAL